MPVGAIVAGIGAATGIAKGIVNLSQAKKIKVPEYKPYEIPEEVARMKGMAEAQMFARNPLAAAQQRAILASQAGAMAGTQRTAQSSSQALAAAAGLQAGTNQAMFQQALQERADYQQRFANLSGAYQAMAAQKATHQEEYNINRLREQQRKQQLEDAGWQSMVGGLQNVGGMMIAGGGSGQMTGLGQGGNPFARMMRRGSSAAPMFSPGGTFGLPYQSSFGQDNMPFGG
jgi:hypothetical protein